MMDQFQLIRELGRGAMGVVYQALQVDLQRDVALKLINVELSTDLDVRQRFTREARTLAALDHPGIVRVFDSGVNDGQMFYAMELLRGNDLWEHAQDRGRLPVSEVLSALVQAADALAYLHEKGLTHRDVKPSNLFLEAGGRLVLTDFGLVSSPESAPGSSATKVLGSPRFVPPEVVTGKKSSPAQDVWALAVSACELLTGAAWVAGDQAGEVFREIARGLKPDVAALPEDVPAWFRDLLASALATAPAQRVTAAQFRDTIRKHIDAQDRAQLATAAIALPSRLMRVPAMSGLPGTGPMVKSRSDKVSRSGRVRVPAEGRARAFAGRRSGFRGALVVLAAIGVGAAAVALALRPRPAPVPGGSSPVAATVASTAVSSTEPPAALPSPAGVFLAAPAPAGHRRIQLTLAGDLPAGANVEAWDGDRRIADAPIGTLERSEERPESRRAVLAGLPPQRTLELRVVVNDRIVGTQTYTTPRVDPVVRLDCWPSEQDVVVDFTLQEPAACTIELQGEPDGAVQRVEMPAQRAHRHVFTELRPLTRYEVRVRLAEGWGGMGGYGFATLAPERAAELRTWLAHLPDDPLSLFDSTPDLRVAEHFHKLLPQTRAEQSGTLKRIAQVIGQLADREGADLLEPFVDKIGADAPQTRAALIEALARARHPRAAELARKWIGQSDDAAALAGCSYALAEAGGAENAQVILDALARHPARVELAPLAARADRGRALGTFREWLAANAGQTARAPAAVAGLAWIGEAAVDDLAAACRGGAQTPTALGALEALAAIPGARALSALTDACRAAPLDPRRLWIAARRGIAALGPDSARAAAAGPAAARRDALCVLGLLGEGSARRVIQHALEDADREVATAAAWALVRMGDRGPDRASDRLRDAIVGNAGALGTAAADRRHAVETALLRIDPLKRPADERLLVPITTWERTGVEVLPGDALAITLEAIAEPLAGPRPVITLTVGGQALRLRAGRQSMLATRAGEVLVLMETPGGAPQRILALYRLTVRRGE